MGSKLCCLHDHPAWLGTKCIGRGDSQSEAPSTDPARLESFSCLCALSHTYLYDICTGIQAPPDTSHCLFFLCPDNTDGVQMDGVLLLNSGNDCVCTTSRCPCRRTDHRAFLGSKQATLPPKRTLLVLIRTGPDSGGASSECVLSTGFIPRVSDSHTLAACGIVRSRLNCHTKNEKGYYLLYDCTPYSPGEMVMSGHLMYSGVYREVLHTRPRSMGYAGGILQDPQRV